MAQLPFLCTVRAIEVPKSTQFLIISVPCIPFGSGVHRKTPAYYGIVLGSINTGRGVDGFVSYGTTAIFLYSSSH